MIDNHEALQKYCCNPFKTHKNNIKRNLQVISVKFAKDLQKNQFAIIPGRKVCRNGKSRLNKLCEGTSSSSSDTDFTRHSTDGEENTCVGQISSCQLNTSLSQIGESPIKLHSVPQHSRSNHGKRKLFSISREMTKRVALALNVPQQEQQNTWRK